MATNPNPDFAWCREERKNQSFFKFLQMTDTSSENMRALPYDLVKNFSENELLTRMKIKTKWGSSWEIEISKNARFYFMEKAGWEKFVSDNHLGDETLAFTHEGDMCFSVSIYNPGGKEMLKPPPSLGFLASSSRIRTKQEEDVMSCDLVPRTAETNGREKNKRKVDFGKKTAKESPVSKMTKNAVRFRRDSAGASSSSVAEFTVVIKKSYLHFMAIPISVKKELMPEGRAMFKIHHPDMKKSWDVVYIVRDIGTCFSGGWKGLVKEYPIAAKDVCKFTFIKPTELVLVVSKDGDGTR